MSYDGSYNLASFARHSGDSPPFTPTTSSVPLRDWDQQHSRSAHQLSSRASSQRSPGFSSDFNRQLQSPGFSSDFNRQLQSPQHEAQGGFSELVAPSGSSPDMQTRRQIAFQRRPRASDASDEEEHDLFELVAPEPTHPDTSAEQSRRQTRQQRRPRASGTWYRPSSIVEEEVEGLDKPSAPSIARSDPPSAQRTPFPSRIQTRRPSWRSSGRSSRLERLSSQEESSLSEVSARRVSEQRQQQLRHEDGWYPQEFLEETRYDTEHDCAGTKEGEGIPPESPLSAYLTQLYIISYLIFFAILGTLARLGVQWLTFYPGAPVVFSNIWANVGGSFFMGFLTEERQLFRAGYGIEAKRKLAKLRAQKTKKLDRQLSKDQSAYTSSKKTVPLYIGLAVGFCGSFTSFSTFMRDVFFALSNDLPSPRNHPPDVAQDVSIFATVPRPRGYSFEAVAAVLILTIASSGSALVVGSHVALALDGVLPVLPFQAIRRFVDPLVVFLGWGSLIGAIIMAVFPPDRPSGPAAVNTTTWLMEQWRGEVIMALVFAPAGCLLRFLFAIKLNSLVPKFPVGTFAANVFGTILLGMCYDLQHVPLFAGGTLMDGGGHVGCQVLQGVQDGFCGALTTVSTWVVELRTLRRRHAWTYGGTSVALGLGALVVIMGSVRWTIGFAPAACSTERVT